MNHLRLNVLGGLEIVPYDASGLTKDALPAQLLGEHKQY